MMDGGVLWTTAAVFGPLLAGLVSLQGRSWAIRTGLVAASVASLVAAGGLALQVAAHGAVLHRLGAWGAPLGIDLRVDGLSAVMLATTAVVGALVSVYSMSYFGELSELVARKAPAARGARYFAPLWLFLWAGLNAIYVSGDLFNIYVCVEILGLTAASLVTLAVTPKATVAGTRYLLVSLAGSMLFLLGVALVYVAAGTLALEDLTLGLPAGALPRIALLLMTVGLLAKTALFPFHAWLPPAHAAAPAPASALLSALVIKGSFYVCLRLWLDVYGGGPESARTVLGFLGGGAIVWGSLAALRQSSLKRLVAYSTVAQIGYLFVLFPLLLDGSGAVDPDAFAGGVYHASAHALAKAAMFLAAGNMTYAVARDDLESISGVAQRIPMSFIAFGVGGLSLAGIPPTGGFVAKWLLLRAAVSQGHWDWAALMAVGGILTVAYVLAVLRYAAHRGEVPEGYRTVPARMEWTAIGLALLVVLMGLRSVEVIGLLGSWFGA